MKRLTLIALLTIMANLSFAVDDFAKTKALADEGNVDAQLTLGQMYCSGKDRGVKRDFAKSFELFLKAANQGNATAQGMLGVSYYYGQGVKKNHYEAYVWLLTAEDSGNLKSKNFRQLIADQLSPDELKKARQQADVLIAEIERRGKSTSSQTKVTQVQLKQSQSKNEKSDKFSYIDELKALAALRDEGILTEEEFQKQKTEILARE